MKFERTRKNTLPTFGVREPKSARRQRVAEPPQIAASHAAAETRSAKGHAGHVKPSSRYANRPGRANYKQSSGYDEPNEQLRATPPYQVTEPYGALNELAEDNHKRANTAVGNGHFRAQSLRTEYESYAEPMSQFGKPRMQDNYPGRDDSMGRLAVSPNADFITSKIKHGDPYPRYLWKHFNAVDSGTIMASRSGFLIWDRENEIWHPLDEYPYTSDTTKMPPLINIKTMEDPRNPGKILIVPPKKGEEVWGGVEPKVYEEDPDCPKGFYTIQENSHEPRLLLQGDYVRRLKDENTLIAKHGDRKGRAINALVELERRVSLRFLREETGNPDSKTIYDNTVRRDILDMIFENGNLSIDAPDYPFHPADRRLRRGREFDILQNEMQKMNIAQYGITAEDITVENKKTGSEEKQYVFKLDDQHLDLKSKDVYNEYIWTKTGGLFDPTQSGDIGLWDGHFAPNMKWRLRYDKKTGEWEWGKPVRGEELNLYDPVTGKVLYEHNSGVRTWGDLRATGQSTAAKACWNGSYLVDSVTLSMIDGGKYATKGYRKPVEQNPFSGMLNNWSPSEFFVLGIEGKKYEDSRLKMLARSHSTYIESFERGKGSTDEFPMYKGEYAIGKSFYDLYWSTNRLLGSLKAFGGVGTAAGLVAGAISLAAAPVAGAVAVGVVSGLVSGCIGHSLYARSQMRLNMIPVESREKFDDVAFNNFSLNGEDTSLNMDILGLKAVKDDFTYFLDGLYSTTYAITNGKLGRDTITSVTGIGAFVAAAASTTGIATGTLNIGTLFLGAAGVTTFGIAGAAICGGLAGLALISPHTENISVATTAAIAGGAAASALTTAGAVATGLIAASSITTIAIAATVLTGGTIALAALALLGGNILGEEQFKHNYDTLSTKSKYRNKVLPPEDMGDHIIRAF